MSVEKPENCRGKPENYRGENLIRKMFLLQVIENTSCRNLSYGRNVTWKIAEFFLVCVFT
jgi:hypothetical protein